jgi:hypothetical protein
MYLKWGTVGERERGGGEEKRGGGQYTSNLGPGWTGIVPHAKKGFQVSKRGLGTGEGFFQAKGSYQGDCAMYLRYNANLTHIVPVVCMLC